MGIKYGWEKRFFDKCNEIFQLIQLNYENGKWKEVPAAQVSCGPAFTHTELKPTWLSTSSNHWGGISQVWGGSSTNYGGVIRQVWGGHQPSMGGSSTKYGGVINQVWGGHQPSMGGSSAKYGGVINQLWGGHQPTMGGSSAKYGGVSTKYGGVINQLWGGSSAKYGGVISQVWGVINQLWGGHQPSMGGSSANYGGGISQVWGGHQPTMGGPSAKYGGGIFPPVCTGSQNRENYFSNTYVLPSVNRTAGPKRTGDKMLNSVALPCLDPVGMMDHHRSDSSYEATWYSQDILIWNCSKLTRQSALIENTSERNKTTHADFFIKGWYVNLVGNEYCCRRTWTYFFSPVLMDRESRSVLLGMIILQQTSALYSKNLNCGFWLIVPRNDNILVKEIHIIICLLSRCNVTAMVNNDEVQCETLPGNIWFAQAFCPSGTM